MTKEELEKEAEQYAIENWEHYEEGQSDYKALKEAYLACAEPREKQIQIDAEQIRNLQKQNGELTDKVKELEAQIEKMKWHKVSDGDLPKDRRNVYVVYLNAYYQLQKTVASFRHKYWVFNGLKTECEIIAWCELPKWEIKEK